VDETRISHGTGAEKQPAILTPEAGEQKTKGSQSCLLFGQTPDFTRKGQAVVVPARRRPWL
jgi:hypothetical protein